MIRIFGKEYEYSDGIVKNFRNRDIELALLLKFNPLLAEFIKYEN